MNSELVLDTLEREGGYRRVSQPLHVADVDFDFAGALVGPDDQQALTLILDENRKTIAAALRRLKAFAVVLERSGSTRPINVVLLSNDPDRDSVEALEQLARVIIVDPNQSLTESLHSLLPLHLPEPIEASQSAEKTLRKELKGSVSPLTQRLLKAGKKSAAAVEGEMRKALMDLAATEQ
jgi:hypothetical protein